MTKLRGLYLMADSGAGDGGTGMGAGGTGVNPQDAAAGNPGVMTQDAAAMVTNRSGRRNPLANVQYGTGGAQAQQDDAAGWQAAKTRHKAQYDAEMQAAVQGRLRDANERLKAAEADQQALATLKPMLDAMAKQHGMEAGNYQGIVDKYLDSDSLYEEESLRTGTPIAALKQIQQLKADRDRKAQQVSQFTQQAQAEQHIRGLVMQAEALKQKYPMFDLQKEMQDEQFVRMTSPNGGLTVEQAFAALHHNELQQYAMQAAAQQTRRQAAETVKANMARPRENAGRTTAPAAQVRSDPRTLKADDFRELTRRATAGGKISFD